jgi:benzil reductase ((S)-benzoin forming)
MIKAILTGHSRGLGAALARALLERDIAILGIARSPATELAEAFPQSLREVPLDLANPQALRDWLESDSLAGFVADADTALLINNAGLLQPVGPLGTLDPAALIQAINVNIGAPLLLANAFVAATRRCADRRIVHVSSGAARSPYAGWGSYCATKAALDHHARATALENIPGLRIASLAPGVIDTAMQAEIRASSIGQFPQKERFEGLKASGQLSTPSAAAERLVDYLLGGKFGEVVDGDLRHLPG